MINVALPTLPDSGICRTQRLRRLVERLRRLPACPPLLVKIAPDLDDESIDAVARLAFEEVWPA